MWVLDLLRKLKGRADKPEVTRDSVFGDLIFTTTHGEPIKEEYLVRKHFKPLLREAGLPNIRLYDLRHTSALLPSPLGSRPKWYPSNSGTLVRHSHWTPTPTCFRTCKRKPLRRWKRL